MHSVIPSKYVCAFRGRRDSYQVPVALAESGRLDQFITDVYVAPWIRSALSYMPANTLEKLRGRREDAIPDNRVQSLWSTAISERLRSVAGASAVRTYAELDPHFSLAAANRARASRANLLLYSSYAWEAFTARYHHDPVKILFQYHPHPLLESKLLTEDHERYPNVGQLDIPEKDARLSPLQLSRERDVWKHADLVFCASTFTKDSLVHAGAKPEICVVLPYGINLNAVGASTPISGFQVLFVGSGVQRKGLHHLIEAWKQARLPVDSKLILVCRVLDAGIEKLTRDVRGLELRRGVSQRELSRLFGESTLFAMPSLVEGFGQVYLEALAHGCPVLGTKSTCLPDLGDEADGIFLVEPGNVDQLVTTLERLSLALPGCNPIRMAALSCAASFPWSKFRSSLRNALPE